MGRRNRRAEEHLPLRSGVQPTLDLPDGTWHVRSIPGSAALKSYRCPGCQQEVRPGTPHVVAWRADRTDGADDRRHWHTTCWQARDRRRPR